MVDVEKETWKNVTRGHIGVLKLDKHGDPVPDSVGPGKVISITKEERMFNKDRAATSALDIFENGFLAPVRLLDDESEAEIASNPNILGESDLKDLFSLHYTKFDARIQEIDNIFTLERLQTLAESDDDINVTVRQTKLIGERLADLRGENDIRPEVDDDNVFARIKAVTPS